jgi:hypothetical protein
MLLATLLPLLMEVVVEKVAAVLLEKVVAKEVKRCLGVGVYMGVYI